MPICMHLLTARILGHADCPVLELQWLALPAPHAEHVLPFMTPRLLSCARLAKLDMRWSPACHLTEWTWSAALDHILDSYLSE